MCGHLLAAHFVQNVVSSYERHFDGVEQQLAKGQEHVEDEILGKECSNLIVLLSELYNFQVISCVLIYDVIRGLLVDELSEFKVELLLKVTRSANLMKRSIFV